MSNFDDELPMHIWQAKTYSRKWRMLKDDLSSEYDIDTPIVEDSQGVLCYTLTITRKADGVVVYQHPDYIYTPEAVRDIISNWRTTAGIKTLAEYQKHIHEK